MAKKRTESKAVPPERLHASVARWGDVTPQELRDWAISLRGFSAQMDALAKSIEVADLESLRIDGAKKIENGSRLVKEFIKAVDTSLTQAKYE